MSANNSEISQSASMTGESQLSDIYIDDYSHLRLSYYQPGSTSTLGESTDESTFERSCDTLETEVNETSIRTIVDEKEDERQKLREYYISQIPDLPHPSYTVAGIIASASRKMGSMQFRYNDRIEQGTPSASSTCQELEFAPQRRSTLKPGEFPKRN